MAETPAPVTSENDYRLPRSVVPDRYRLTIEPDLAAATFRGVEQVEVRVVEPVTEVVLNAAELAITGARMKPAGGGAALTATVTLDAEQERATLVLEGTAQPGPWTLHLEFSGPLGDKLVGFYRSTFRDSDGTEQVIAATQFEATHARQAFPCWDEPDRKAVFAVTLVVDPDQTAISNWPITADEPTATGKRRVTFADTIPMSTYLVAFVVGPLRLTDPVDVDGTPLRVAHVPGREGLVDFALEIGAAALRFFAGYFGTPYPGAKLDLVALPDFASGAMENLGAVTFRETLLLVDRDTASRDDLENVALVVAHELAHMWFGDLVTMKWWNGLWLNEAFATFMELVAVEDFRPEWEPWVRFGPSRASALLTDGLGSTRPVEFPVANPREAEGMFDVLTYDKGAAVVKMLEQYLGAKEFRDGIRRYIADNALGNTETTDLWDALETATGEPVRATMDSWIFQGGYPVVSVEPAPAGDGGGDEPGDESGGGAIVLRQRRFWYLGGGQDREGPLWHVPVLLRAGDGDRAQTRRALLSSASLAVDLGERPDWVVANSGGWGFYRTRYAPELLDPLTGGPGGAGGRLSPVERLNLVGDTWAVGLAGLAPASEFVGLVGRLGDETDPTVWSLMLGPFSLLERILAPAGVEAMRAFVRALAGPALRRVGWERRPDDDDNTSILRATLVGALGGLGEDPGVQRQARGLHDRYLADRNDVDPDLVRPVVGVVARTGGPDDYDRFLARIRTPATPQEEVRYLYALAGFRHPVLLQRTLDLVLSDEVRTQNAPFLVNALLANPAAETVWSWVEANWSGLTQRFPDSSHARMVDNASLLTGLADRVRAFLLDHPVTSGRRTVAQILERLEVNRAFQDREADGLVAAFDRA